MSYILTKKVVAANASAAKHYANATASRTAFNAAVENPVAAELWAAVDRQTAEIMAPIEGEALYGLVFPLAKTVDIGDLAMMWRKAGDEFEARSSMDGHHVKPLQRTASEWDGTVIPVHTSSYYEEWRESRRNRQQFLDDQAAATRSVRKRIIDDLFNGTQNASFKNMKSLGILNSPNVQALDLAAGTGIGVDFTSSTLTMADARKGIIAIVNGLTGPTNGAVGMVDILLDGKSYFNLVTLTVAADNPKSFLDMLRELPGVRSIQMETVLADNTAIGLIANQEYIAPIVGAAVSTFAQTRTGLLDNYNYTCWAATGLQIKADKKGRSGVLLASGA